VISALSRVRVPRRLHAVVFLFSLYLQQQRGLSALQTGLVFLPTTLLSAAISPVSTWLTHRYSPLVPIFGGLTMMALHAGPRRPACTDSNLADLRAPDPDRDHRPTGHATNYRRAARLRARPPIRTGQRRVQFQPPDRRRPVHRRFRSPTQPPATSLITGLRHSLIITAVVVLLAATANALFRHTTSTLSQSRSRRDDL